MPAKRDEGRTKKWVPLAADYMRALRSLEAQLPESYVRMLQFHYDRPDKTVTAASLAKGVGFKGYRGANGHYGRLGGLVGKRVGWHPEEEGDIKLGALVKFEHVRGEWHWIMRKELAQAIKGLGWAGRQFFHHR
jgi:5-methylcytosine-specific restriction protein A